MLSQLVTAVADFLRSGHDNELLTYIAVYRTSLATLPVRLIGKGMYARGIYPAIIEIEQGTNGDGVINRLVSPSGFAKRIHILSRYSRRVAIHLANETKQSFVFLL